MAKTSLAAAVRSFLRIRRRIVTCVPLVPSVPSFPARFLGIVQLQKTWGQRQNALTAGLRRISTPIRAENAKTTPRLKPLDSFAAIWFATFSAVTFLAFGYDKWRASRSGNRVPESSLAMLGALGGWLGGLIGMMVFRHKTAKWTFKFKYALALIPFAAEVWAWMHWR